MTNGGNMAPRIDITKYLTSGPARSILALQREVQSSGLEHSLLELMKIRASQINGCAYCIDMHTKDARARGETEQRIYALNAWRESPFYTDRERAALEWTESLTLVSKTQVPDAVYEEVRKHFTEAEVVALTFAVVAITSWNRLAISLRAPAGTYQPKAEVARSG